MANIKVLHLSHKESALLFYSLKDFVTVLKETAENGGISVCEEISRQYALDLIRVLANLNDEGLPVILTVDTETLFFLHTTIIQFIQRNDEAAALFAGAIGLDGAIESFTLHICWNMNSLELAKRIVKLQNQIS